MSFSLDKEKGFDVDIRISPENSVKSSGNPVHYPDGGKAAYLALLGCFLSLFATLGTTNANGVIENYIQRQILPHQLPLSISWIFACFNYASFACVLVLSPLYDQVGARPIFTASAVLFAAGMMCFSVSHLLYQFILSYLLTGLGVLCSFSASVNTISHWFDKKRGTAMGLMYTGSSIGGILFPIVLNKLFDRIGFGWSIRVIGFLGFGLSLLSVVFADDRRKELGLAETNLNPLMVAIKRINLRVLKDPMFLMFFAAGLGNSSPMFISLNYMVSYATTNGWDASLAFYLPVAFNAASFFGRILGGILSDRYGRFNYFLMVNLVNCVGVLVCWLPPVVGHSHPGLFIYSAFAGFASGSYFQSLPTCLAQISSVETFSWKYGTFSLLLSSINFANLPIGGAIIGTKHGGEGYDRLVILSACYAVMGLIFTCLCRYRLSGIKWTIV